MVPLCRALMDFVKAQMLASDQSLILPAFSSIFSRRVFDCMPRELLLESLVRDSLQGQPGQVHVKAKGANVTLGTPTAASWFGKRMGATESMELGGGLLRLGACNARANVLLGGPPLGTVPCFVRDVSAKVFEEAE